MAEINNPRLFLRRSNTSSNLNGVPSATKFGTISDDRTPRKSGFQSFLNNDGIDQMKPEPKKASSSISLSDQWAGSLQQMTKLNEPVDEESNAALEGLVKKSQTALSSLSLTESSGKRYRKKIIDHPRVASYAFAFDIDGVIKNGPQTIPYAREAMRMLNGDNKYRILVPYIFVTNGGGNPESERAKDLSKRLDCEINEEQIIQGHTPMKSLASLYKNVLVVGGVGDTCRKIAEGYGFENVYIPLDVMYWNPAVSPYYTLSEEEKKICKKDVNFSKTKIDAILVFADSRNWAADEQIILELLLSKGGYMGTVSKNYNQGPALYFAHSDFIWSTDYKLSRYGMGALQVSIAALYKETTGKELKVTRFGKPQRGTFKFAKKVLSNWRRDVLEEYVEVLAEIPDGEDEDAVTKRLAKSINMGPMKKKCSSRRGSNTSMSSTESDESGDSDEGLTFRVMNAIGRQIPQPSTVYFVGDTPDSDIRFANSHDESWYSILVKTGVYQEGTVPKYQPKKIEDNVLEAVKFAIRREAKKELDEWNADAVDPEN